MARLHIDPADWALLSRLLDEALELPAAERQRWLAGLAPEHRPLEPRLRELLKHSPPGGASSPLDTIPRLDLDPTGAAAGGEPPDARPGELVGPYRLVRPIGEGGMGSVWLAERADGMVQRPVALKLPRGLGWGAALAERMAREREILASLAHPHIARLYDAGVTAEGRPWLALEYVEGSALSAHLREARPDVRGRLGLFLQVAQAVAHAHAHLVVHRDLKPSNVLVTADGQVRLLDFGIGKLLEQGSAPETELTRLGGRALTPGYASPEQIRGEPVGVATDVYSLGVILFEMLTGARPYRLARDSPAALEEAILQAEPARPSEVAEDAGARRALRGDLDTVVLKALKKRPEERYPTANAFAEDVERWLDGRPVRAQPDSRGYRLRRFVGRNRLAVGAAAAVAVAVVAGAGAALWQARVARAEQRRAEEVKSFIEAIFREADPYGAQGRGLSGVELLLQARKRIEGMGQERAELRVELLNLLGASLLGLGDTDDAEQVSRQALDEAARWLAPDRLQALRARLLATDVARVRGRTREMRQELDRLVPALEPLARSHPEELVRALQNRAHMGIDDTRFAEAIAAAQAAFDLALARLGPHDPRTVDASNLLAESYQYETDTPEAALAAAERGMRFALDAYRDQPAHPHVVAAREVYARALSQAGRDAAAVEEWKRALREAGQAFGPDAPLVGQIASNILPGQRRLGDVRGAIENASTAVEVLSRHAQGDSRDVATSLVTRGVTFLLARRGAEALRDLSTATETLARILGPENDDTLTARLNRGLALAYVGRTAEARAELAATAELYRVHMPQYLLYANHLRGAAERLAGSGEQALRWQERALGLVADDGLREWNRLRVLAELGLAQSDAGRYREARASAEEALALSRKLQSHDSPMRADALVGLARAHLGLGSAAACLGPVEQADSFWRGFDPGSRWAGEAALWLGRCHAALGHGEEARQALSRAARILERSPLPLDARLARLARRP